MAATARPVPTPLSLASVSEYCTRSSVPPLRCSWRPGKHTVCGVPLILCAHEVYSAVCLTPCFLVCAPPPLGGVAGRRGAATRARRQPAHGHGHERLRPGDMRQSCLCAAKEHTHKETREERKALLSWNFKEQHRSRSLRPAPRTKEQKRPQQAASPP